MSRLRYYVTCCTAHSFQHCKAGSWTDCRGRAHAGRLLPVQHSGTFLPSEIRVVITFFASKQVSKLLTFLLCSQCPYNNNLQQCFIFLSIPQPMNTTMSILFLNTLVCARARTCVCVYLTCHSKFCSPLLEHCLFFQDLPSSADGHCIVCVCVRVCVCVCFIQNQIRYRCYKRKSVGLHPVHL